MRRILGAIFAIPLFVLSPVLELTAGVDIAWQTATKLSRKQDDSVPVASPEKTSARRELEQLQIHNGLALAFVDQHGLIKILNFKNRDFVARSMEVGGYSGAVARDGNFAALWGAGVPLSLAIVRLDGTTMKKYSGVRGALACWSYDSSRLVLETSQFQLQVMDVASSAVQTLPIEGASNEVLITSQCWSPDGKQIVYQSNDGYVSVFDFEMCNSTRLVKGTNPTWLPDGSWIAYRDGETYYAMHPSGGGRKKLFHKTRAISGLWWSPDSRFVAYIHEDLVSPLGYSRVMVRRLADGSEEWVAQGVGAGNSFQWVQNPKLVEWVESGNRKR